MALWLVLLPALLLIILAQAQITHAQNWVLIDDNLQAGEIHTINATYSCLRLDYNLNGTQYYAVIHLYDPNNIIVETNDTLLAYDRTTNDYTETQIKAWGASSSHPYRVEISSSSNVWGQNIILLHNTTEIDSQHTDEVYVAVECFKTNVTTVTETATQTTTIMVAENKTYTVTHVIPLAPTTITVAKGDGFPAGAALAGLGLILALGAVALAKKR